MEAFELRLWDSRIGRWLSPDPLGQYHSTYLGLGNNPLNGIERNGADWWQLTKEGNLVLIKETNDPYNVIFDTEGVEISRTSAPLYYFTQTTIQIYGDSDSNYGTNHEFYKLRMAQADLIALAIFNDKDIYLKMKRRAKETHWKSTEVLDNIYQSGNLPARKAQSTLFDVTVDVLTLIATRKPKAVGLNSFQKGKLAYKFGGFIEASFDQSDMLGLQQNMGMKLYNLQQDFITGYPMNWNFLQQTINTIKNPKDCRCD